MSRYDAKEDAGAADEVLLCKALGLEAWCATGGSDVDGGWSRAELEEHVRDEHSTFNWLLELMMQRIGFEIEDTVYSDDGIFAKYVLRRS